MIALPNQSCSPDPFSKSVWCQPNPKRLLPGDFANNASECHSGQTDSAGFCKGITAGKCGSHADCDTGLYCDSVLGYCLKAGEENHSCDSGRLCQPYLTCYEGTCKTYGHLKIGQKVADCGSVDNCETRYMNSETCVCEHGPTLLSPSKIDKPNVLCQYEFGDGTIARNMTRWPVCGYSSTGNLVCPKLQGDLESKWTALLQYMSLRPPCHVSHKFAVCDKAQVLGCGKYAAAAKLVYEVNPETASAIEGMAECMKTWTMKRYWFPACVQKSFSVPRASQGAATILGALIAILLLF